MRSVQAALAQLVEHRIRNAGVVGSNPIGGTTFLKATKATATGILTVSFVALKGVFGGYALAEVARSCDEVFA